LLILTDAHTVFFGPAERAIAARNPQAFGKILQFYTDLLRQWTHQVSPARSPQPALTLGDQKILNDLVTHVANMSMSLIVSLPPDSGSSLTSSILSFYELVSSSTQPNSVPIMPPPMYLSYLLVQGTSTTTMSRICGVVGNYKTAFDRHPKPLKSYYPSGMTDRFNWCLRDIYHLLWITRAFHVSENKCVGLYCDPLLRESLNAYLSSIDRKYAISMAFGLSNNPLLASLSAAAWGKLEEEEIQKQQLHRDYVSWHKGPVSQLSLAALGKNRGVDVTWDRYKVHVLMYLAARGLGGIKDLMFATASDLKKVFESS
jgi:centromere protein I